MNCTPHIVDAIHPNTQVEWGNRFYELLHNYCHTAIFQDRKIDHRKICLLLDHKKALVYKMKYFEDQNIVDHCYFERCLDLEHSVSLALQLPIKYNTDENQANDFASKIDALLENIQFSEEELLLDLQKRLN